MSVNWLAQLCDFQIVWIFNFILYVFLDDLILKLNGSHVCVQHARRSFDWLTIPFAVRRT